MKTITSAILIFIMSALPLDAEVVDTFCCEETFNPLLKTRIEAGYSAGQFIGIQEGYGELGIFVPIYLRNTLASFAECRGYRFNNSKWGLSSGIGLRQNLQNGHAAGANVYYDYLEGSSHESFNRLGFGLEWLGKHVDFRLNAYLPIGSESHFSKATNYNYPGSYRATSCENQFSIAKGFDAEVGGYFWHWRMITAYGAIGPYYFSSKHPTHYFGAQGRIEVAYLSFISLQIRSSYDSENQSRTQAQIQISIPLETLQNGISYFCENMLLQPVRRNGVIFTEKCCDYTWNW